MGRLALFLPAFLDNFLSTTFISTPFFVLDGWMFVHFTSGAIIGLLSHKYERFRDWQNVLLLLMLYELLEFVIWGVFLQHNDAGRYTETLANVVWDVIFGMIAYTLTRKKQKQVRR